MSYRGTFSENCLRVSYGNAVPLIIEIDDWNDNLIFAMMMSDSVMVAR